MKQVLAGLTLVGLLVGTAFAEDAVTPAAPPTPAPAVAPAPAAPAVKPEAPAAATAPTPAKPLWRVSTSLAMGDVIKVSCSMQFPSAAGTPTLRLSNQGVKGGAAHGSARFDLVNADALLVDAKGTIDGVKIGIDTQPGWEALKGSWLGPDTNIPSKFSVTANSDIDAVLDPIAHGSKLTVTVPGTGDARTFEFTLEGSSAALQEFRACLAR